MTVLTAGEKDGMVICRVGYLFIFVASVLSSFCVILESGLVSLILCFLVDEKWLFHLALIVPCPVYWCLKS